MCLIILFDSISQTHTRVFSMVHYHCFFPHISYSQCLITVIYLWAFPIIDYCVKRCTELTLVSRKKEPSSSCHHRSKSTVCSTSFAPWGHTFRWVAEFGVTPALHVCVLLSVCGIKGLGLFVVLLCAFICGVVTTVTQSVMSVGWVVYLQNC